MLRANNEDDIKRFEFWGVLANMGIFRNYRVDHIYNIEYDLKGVAVKYNPVGSEISYPEDEDV